MAEQPLSKLTCVQCSKNYIKESNNIEGICQFHTAPSYERIPGCCGSHQPCKKGKHRDQHHCEYPYSAFFNMARGINGYTDTLKLWGVCEDKDLNDLSVKQFIKVGKLLRWKSGAIEVNENLLFIQVGTLSVNSKYYLHIYNEPELDSIGKVGNTEIFRTSPSDIEYSLAKWVIQNQQLVGIHLEAKSKTSEVPTVKIISFVPFPLTFGKIQTFSAGGLIEAKPETKYTFPAPEKLKIGPIVNDEPKRARRTDFPTQGCPNLKIKLKENFRCNELSTPKYDIWDGCFSLVNTLKGEAKEPIIIVSAKCEWRMVGSQEWKEVDYFEMEKSFTCFPMQNTDIPFIIRIKDESKYVLWHNRSYIARHQPIRFRVTFEDVFGEFASQVFEYVFQPYKHEIPKDEELKQVTVSVDNIDTYDRYNLAAKRTFDNIYTYGNVCEVDGQTFNESDFRSLVFKATQTKQSEVLLFEKDTTPEKGYHVNKKAWALIDLNCNRVYAIKLLIMGVSDNTVSGHMGYLELDLYGKIDQTRPNSPAYEDVTPDFISELASENAESEVQYAQNDDFDDALIEYVRPPNPMTAPQGPPSATQVAFQNVAHNVDRMANSFVKLNTVAQNLERIAKSTAQVAEIFSK